MIKFMSKSNIYLGVDIGATKTLFLVVKFSARGFKVLESMRCETPHNAKRILAMIEDNYRVFNGKHKIEAIGIGFAGPVDYKKDIAWFGPNLKIGKIEFKKNLRRSLKLQVEIDNDAKCSLLAESAFGPAKGFKNVVGVVIGTGLGSAIIADGKLYRGADNFAGEIGHAFINGREFEESVSGTGLSRVYEKLTGKKADGYHVVNSAKTGDAKAMKAIDLVAEDMGILLANIIQIFNPEMIVLGGGMSKVGMLVNKAKGHARKKIFVSSAIKTPIVASKLGQTAVALGAAWMVKK